MSNGATQAGTTPKVKGAGKKATLAKRQMYANPLPVGQSLSASNLPTGRRSWWDRLNEWTRWLYSNPASVPTYHAWYDDTTKSVWMYDTGEAQQLWTQGFFGKGNLSRSEPTWVARKQAEQSARERGELTAEQVTQKRREQRKLLKIERAKAAVKAGIQLPDGITALGGKLDPCDFVQTNEGEDTNGVLWRGDEDIPTIEAGVARVKGLKYFSADVTNKDSFGETSDHSESEDEAMELEGVEHFQLTMIEAFFLAGMLGCLKVRNSKDVTLSIEELYRLCLTSHVPAEVAMQSQTKALYARPDNPFLLSYVVYHHFRSLGWIVKSGTKFCVDFLLYKKGPVFGHAEFSVLVIPEYADERDACDSPFALHHNGGDKSWIWFSMVNRVNSQVQKKECPGSSLASPSEFVKSLQKGYYRVREVSIRRWVPARMKA